MATLVSRSKAATAGAGTAALISVLVAHAAFAETFRFAEPFIVSLATSVIILCIAIREVMAGRFLSPTILFSAVMWAHFVFPQWLLSFGYVEFNSGSNLLYLLPAAAFVLLCVICFDVGHWLALTRRPRRSIFISRPTFAVVYGSLAVIGVFGRGSILAAGAYTQVQRSLLDLAGQSMPLMRTLEMFPNFAFFAAYASYLLSPSRNNRMIALGFWIFNVMYWIPTGRKYEAIISLTAPFVIRLFLGRPLGSPGRILAMVLLIVALFPLTHAYRVAQAQFGLVNSQDTSLSAVWSGIVDSVMSASDADINPAHSYPLSRLNLLESVAGALRVVDHGQNLRLGSDYVNLIANQIPRAVWAGKPDVEYGNEFGVLIRMLPVTDYMTAISVTLPAEAFLNFGFGGCLVFLVLSVAATNLFSWARGAGWIGCVVYTMFVFTFIYIGSTFALYYTPLMRNIGFVCVLYVLARYWFNHKTSRIVRVPAAARDFIGQ